MPRKNSTVLFAPNKLNIDELYVHVVSIFILVYTLYSIDLEIFVL
jgi:hypothetical protein